MSTVLAAGAVGSGQAPDAEGYGWRAWVEAVDAHQPGERDAPLRRIAAWSRDDLRDAIRHVPRHGLDVTRIVTRGLVLHTDIAVLYRTPDGYDLEPTGRPVLVLADGEEVGRMSPTFHWDLGRRLIDLLPKGPDRITTARSWYRATAALLQEWGEYPEFRLQIYAGLDELGDDPVLLMYDGTKHQAYAGAALQRFMADLRGRGVDGLRAAAASAGGAMLRSATFAPPGANLPGAPDDERDLAERLFRRALRRVPALVEARIRLAHVLSDAGHHDDARAELARARTQALPPFLDYYAALLAGREALRAGTTGEARDAFTRAAASFPRAQAPRLGLSRVATAEGDLEAARTALAPPDAPAPSIAADPWLWYEHSHAPSADVQLADMRREFSR